MALYKNSEKSSGAHPWPSGDEPRDLNMKFAWIPNLRLSESEGILRVPESGLWVKRQQKELRKTLHNLEKKLVDLWNPEKDTEPTFLFQVTASESFRATILSLRCFCESSGEPLAWHSHFIIWPHSLRVRVVDWYILRVSQLIPTFRGSPRDSLVGQKYESGGKGEPQWYRLISGFSKLSTHTHHLALNTEGHVPVSVSQLCQIHTEVQEFAFSLIP